MTRITAAADKKNQAQPVSLRYCVHCVYLRYCVHCVYLRYCVHLKLFFKLDSFFSLVLLSAEIDKTGKKVTME